MSARARVRAPAPAILAAIGRAADSSAVIVGGGAPPPGRAPAPFINYRAHRHRAERRAHGGRAGEAQKVRASARTSRGGEGEEKPSRAPQLRPPPAQDKTQSVQRKKKTTNLYLSICISKQSI